MQVNGKWLNSDKKLLLYRQPARGAAARFASHGQLTGGMYGF